MTRLAELLHTSVAYLSGELDDDAPIMGRTVIRAIQNEEGIEGNVVTKYTPIIEQKPTNFTYWGSVLDETQKVLVRGDTREISLIETLLNSACEMIVDYNKTKKISRLKEMIYT